MSSDRFREHLYQEFLNFFDNAEQTRRWNPMRDVPWDRINPETPEAMALCAETFLGVEGFLPDYIAGGLQVFRNESVGQRWFVANWGYEELKHSMALQLYLIRSGKRTEEQMADYQAKLMNEQWVPPFDTARRITIYGALQEMATFVIYLRQEKAAKEAGDEALAAIYRLNARDECAHARFYEMTVRAYLEEDREATVLDIAHVAANFQMPGVGIVPDYDARIAVMRDAGRIDRDVFLQKIYLPTLRRLGVERAEITAAISAQRKAIRAARENAVA
jgi:acyl-[acyl-carrier-protein] desaturase